MPPTAHDLGPKVDTHPGSGRYTVKRREGAGYDTNGRAVGGTESTFTIRGLIRPASGKVLERLPEGYRTSDTRVLHTSTTTLRGVNDATGQPSDRVVVDGRDFEIFEVRGAEPFGFSRYALLADPVSGAGLGGGSPGVAVPVQAVDVVVTPNLDLTSTNVQAALEELQSEILNFDVSDLEADISALQTSVSALETQVATNTGDISALDTTVDGLVTQVNANAADLSNHIAATAAHGASGAVVGTNNTQTLTNKTHAGKFIISTVAVGQDALEIPADSQILLRSLTSDARIVASQGYLSTDRFFSAPLLRTTGGTVSSGTPASLRLFGEGGNTGATRSVRLEATLPLTTAGAQVVGVYNSTTQVLGVDKDGKLVQTVGNAGAVVGNVTANTPVGKAVIGAGNTSVVVTNSLVTANSLVMLTPAGTPQAGMNHGVTVSAGSFTIELGNALVADQMFFWEVRS